MGELDAAGVAGAEDRAEAKADVAADPVEMATAGKESEPEDANPVAKPEIMLSRLRTNVAISPRRPILLNPSA